MIRAALTPWRTAENSATYLLPELKPHMGILDVGCGPGTITAGLAGYVPQGHVTGIDAPSKIVFGDTGYLFPETHQHMESLRSRFSLNVWTYRTKNDPIAYLHKAGEENPTWRNNIDACCAANKNEPFDRAMREPRPRPGCAVFAATRPRTERIPALWNGRPSIIATRSLRC